MQQDYYAVIMAGGVGSRFWPVSTRKFPKQFHDMLGKGDSLLQRTFKRLSKLIPESHIYIATNKDYKGLVMQQLTGISENQVVPEPAMRNTAPCVLYSALKIEKENPNAVMIVAPSDHWIEDEDEFIRNIQLAFDACQKEDILMTLGIRPSYPNTGYGYIEYEKSDSAIKKVYNFTEKPDLERAQKFIEKGNYLWNAGIFIWSIKSIVNAFKTWLPEMDMLIRTGQDEYNTTGEAAFIDTNYPLAENISIDYGIMQKAKNIYTLPVEFGWNDLGTWNSLYEKLDKDAENNAVINAQTLFDDATGNMISVPKGKNVVIKGLEDFIVVDKEDVLLIIPRKDEQEIKQLVSKVKDTLGDDLV